MILDNRIWGHTLVNTGTSLLGTVYFADSYEYLIPEDVDMLKEPSLPLWSNCISRLFLVTFIGNLQLHKSGYLCAIVVTVLKNKLLYQVYNTPSTAGIRQSWYLVYEEVVPVNTQLAPAANISLGLSALKLRGVLYGR